MKTISKAIITTGLLLLSNVTFAQGDVNDSTSTGQIHVISGENIGGAAHDGRKLLSDFKDTYNGAVASGGNVYSEYFISWPNLYKRHKNILICNISRGSCSDRAGNTFILSSNGLSAYVPSCSAGIGCGNPQFLFNNFYPWIR